MTELSTAAPAAALSSPAATARPRWGLWTTFAWSLLLALIYYATQFGLVFGLFVWNEVDPDAGIAVLTKIVERGDGIALVTFGALVTVLPVLALIVRGARVSFRDYLALHRPRWRDLLIGIVVIVAVLMVANFAMRLAGRPVMPNFVIDVYTTSRDAGVLLWLALALVVAAPVGEELFFRGFLYRGMAGSFLKPAGAIVITSAIWAAMHVQYDLAFMALVFALGLTLGVLRWRSGSTLLTIGLHALINAASLVETALVVGGHIKL